MKVVKDSLIAAIGGFSCILLLSYLDNFENIYIWLIPSFGASMVLVMSVHKSDLAQPKNIFFGHLLTALVGVLCLLFIPLPNYILIPLAAGIGVGLMILFNVTHPPAGGNPIIVIIGGVSFDYLLSPIITGSIVILVFGVILNRFLLKKNYPK